MKQYTIEYYISKNLQQRTNQIKMEDSESYLYNYLIRKFIQSSPESFSCRCLLPNHVLNQSLISYTLCYHPLTHFELLNLDEQSETQQARVVQRRLERNISSFNFVLNFHFQPFFQLYFWYRYSFATKYNLYSGLPFSDHPLLAVNYQIPAIQTEQFMVTNRDVISIRAFNKKAHE